MIESLFRQNARLLLLSLLFSLGCATAAPEASRGAGPWRAWADPAAAGWSAEGLEAARALAEENQAGAVIVVERGTVVLAWGEIDRPLPIYSMRKGIYSVLAGMLVDEGRLDPDATLAELGVDDLAGLSAEERGATVRQILSSRSGIYHESAYEPASMKRGRPVRGAHEPGTHFYYNNWDFNLVAHLIESAGGASFGEHFRERLAEPLSMEDWSEEDVFEFLEPSRSRYPAQIFRLSARDLARVGQLLIQDGKWNGRQLVSEEWIRASWAPETVFGADDGWTEGAGFGYLWWIHPAREGGDSPLARHDVFLTRGSDGQVLALIPALEIVFVHQTDTENGLEGTFEKAMRLLDRVLAARSPGREVTSAQTVAVEPEPFSHARPATPKLERVAWTAEAIEAVTGTYALSPQITFELRALDGRLFARPKGAPLSEVELFLASTGEIFSPAVAVALHPGTSRDGHVQVLEGVVEGRAVRLTRVE